MRFFGGLLKKKPVKERLPEGVLMLEDVVPQSLTVVKIKGSLPSLGRKPGSRHDRRRMQLEGSGTGAEEKMKKRSKRKGRRSRKRREKS